MLSPSARVRRASTVTVVDATELVPGDVVLLEAGDRVPADGRLWVAESVEVDESALTGESQPVAKSVAAAGAPNGAVGDAASAGTEVSLAERTSMAYMNTTLTRGRAELLVTATGMGTQVGSIAGMLSSAVEPETPLQVQLDAVGRRIALLGGVAVALYAAVDLVRGGDLGEIALSAVALAVATVPEGLPAVLALTLALGVQRMARRGAIVKRLASVETLGAATVVCTDKTGTLTLNQMTARRVVVAGRRIEVTGEGYRPVGRAPDHRRPGGHRWRRTGRRRRHRRRPGLPGTGQRRRARRHGRARHRHRRPNRGRPRSAGRQGRPFSRRRPARRPAATGRGALRRRSQVDGDRPRRRPGRRPRRAPGGRRPRQGRPTSCCSAAPPSSPRLARCRWTTAGATRLPPTSRSCGRRAGACSPRPRPVSTGQTSSGKASTG